MNAKGIISALVGVGLLVGALGLWFVWSKFSETEERGVALTMKVAPPKEDRDRMEKELNALLDREELLEKLVSNCDLVEFYGVESKAEAIGIARDRTRVYFPTPRKLFIMHQAKRYQRGENDEIGRKLGELFRDAAFGPVDQSASGGL